MTLKQLRTRLDPFTGRIVYNLWQRRQYPLNTPVYTPGGVPWADTFGGDHNVSFLEFTLQQMERVQDLLGKHMYAEEQPLYPQQLQGPAVQRKPGALRAIPYATIDVREDLLAYYQTVLSAMCERHDEPETYGMTAYTDATLLLWVSERLNHGKHVAYAKAAEDSENRFRLKEVSHDPVALFQRLQDKPREGLVLRHALAYASALNAADGFVSASSAIDPELGFIWTDKPRRLEEQTVVEFFKWLIRTTTEVQVKYLQAENVQRALGWRG